jgi:hypothetical protein
MPNLDPWLNRRKNNQLNNITTATTTEKKEKSNFEKHLLSGRNECQKIIEPNFHQHPTFLERYQKIIEMIDWTLEIYNGNSEK